MGQTQHVISRPHLLPLRLFTPRVGASICITRNLTVLRSGWVIWYGHEKRAASPCCNHILNVHSFPPRVITDFWTVLNPVI